MTSSLLGLVSIACAPHRAPLLAVFAREVTVYVAVSERVAKTDNGNVAAMVDAVEADLRDDGRSVSIVAARLDEDPPLPRVEIQVTSSDSGDADLRGAGQLTQLLSPVTGVALVGAGAGSMIADAYVVAEGTHPRYLGRFHGSSFGAVSEQAIAAGESVGHQIARRLQR